MELPLITLAARMLPQSDGELVELLRLPMHEVTELREDAAAAPASTRLLVAMALYQGREHVQYGAPEAVARIAAAVFDEAMRMFRGQLDEDLGLAWCAGASEDEIWRICKEALVRAIGPDALDLDIFTKGPA